MNKLLVWLLLLLLVITLVIGCSTAPQPTSQAQPKAKIEVILSNKPREKRAIGPAETILQPNCGGSSSVSNQIERSHAIIYSMDVSGQVALSADGSLGIPGIGSVQVGTEVAARYGVTYGEEQRVSRSLTVSAKEGTNMLHTIQQYEYWETGEIIISVSDQSLRLPYSFRRDFGIELLNSRNEGNCPSNSIPQLGSAQPTSAPIQSGLNCTFIDELVRRGSILQRLESPRGVYAGVQIRLAYAVDVPAGWIVHNSGKELTCPCHFDAGTVASFWLPESCRPLQSSQAASSANTNPSCQAIIGRLPNSPQEVRAKFGIPADKGIRMFYEICQEAPNGFIVEESPSLLTLQVPQGGCIDSYSGAKFSDATVPEKLGGGRRAYSGSVTTTSLTYRIAGCELKP